MMSPVLTCHPRPVSSHRREAERPATTAVAAHGSQADFPCAQAFPTATQEELRPQGVFLQCRKHTWY